MTMKTRILAGKHNLPVTLLLTLLSCLMSLFGTALSYAANPITVSPTSLTFGSQAVGTTSSAQTVTVTNNSTISYSGSYAISGDFANSGSGSCGTTLAAHASCTIGINFTPTAPGVRSGGLSLAGVQAVSLSGVGVDNAAPTAILDAPATVPFGSGFSLSASRSFDNGGGTIASYIWTSLDVSAGTFSANMDVSTTTPSITIVVSPDNPIPVGKHTFRLVVVDNSGNRSTPVTADYYVIDTERPTAVLQAPRVVNYGGSFTLDGTRSSDIGGTVVAYRWTCLTASVGAMVLNTPIQTSTPTYTVVQPPNSSLPLGRHDFQLEVVDSSGNVSSPATASVIIADTIAPTAILDAPATVPFGSGFSLSASRSFDSGGGTIASYIWTSLDVDAGAYASNTPVSTTTPSANIVLSPASPIPVGRHSFQLVVVDDSGNVSNPARADIIVTETYYPLDVIVSGNGEGSVISASTLTGNPRDIACPPTCNTAYHLASNVSLSAIPAWYSYVTWAGTDGTAGNSASLIMNAARTVTATFNQNPNTKLLPSTTYGTLNLAYKAAAPNGGTIQAQASSLVVFSEKLVCNNPYPIVIEGGKNPAFSASTGFTVIQGGLEISNGKVTLSGVKLRPAL